ncbi:MAG: metallophosphoesterase [Fulvivirga sp.]|uniref:metallophosphoesterase n=1 Tax=Fulvivirga sp. TaxID=1931237 RepID=UPI0032ECCB26
MNTIQYLSDLHLEFNANHEFLKHNPIVPVSDILIIAGDFGVLERDKSDKMYRDIDSFLDFLSVEFKQVYIIPGNHEYYNGFNIKLSRQEIRIPIRENILLLNNSVEIIYNHKFIFSTFWSFLSDNFPRYRFSDFHRCMYDGYHMTVNQYNLLHIDSTAFINSEIEDNPRQHKLVIVTHHLPSLSLIAPQYLGSDLNPAFASFSDGLIHKSKAYAWIYGHSHSNMPTRYIGNTMLLTNPLGYIQQQEHNKFDNARLLMME